MGSSKKNHDSRLARKRTRAFARFYVIGQDGGPCTSAEMMKEASHEACLPDLIDPQTKSRPFCDWHLLEAPKLNGINESLSKALFNDSTKYLLTNLKKKLTKEQLDLVKKKSPEADYKDLKKKAKKLKDARLRALCHKITCTHESLGFGCYPRLRGACNPCTPFCPAPNAMADTFVGFSCLSKDQTEKCEGMIDEKRNNFRRFCLHQKMSNHIKEDDKDLSQGALTAMVGEGDRADRKRWVIRFIHGCIDKSFHQDMKGLRTKPGEWLTTNEVRIPNLKAIFEERPMTQAKLGDMVNANRSNACAMQRLAVALIARLRDMKDKQKEAIEGFFSDLCCRNLYSTVCRLGAKVIKIEAGDVDGLLQNFWFDVAVKANELKISSLKATSKTSGYKADAFDIMENRIDSALDIGKAYTSPEQKKKITELEKKVNLLRVKINSEKLWNETPPPASVSDPSDASASEL